MGRPDPDRSADRDRPWVFRTYSGHPSAGASNALYRANLAKGQTGLSVAFDLPTQTGYDADHPLARGEVGKVGVPISSIEDMEMLFEGIPFANETVWWHRRSGTLIVTDLLQWWQGDMSLPARLYARLTGVRHRLGVPTTVRLLVRQREDVRRSARRILDWSFERVITAHNAVIDTDARQQVEQALSCWL